MKFALALALAFAPLAAPAAAGGTAVTPWHERITPQGDLRVRAERTASRGTKARVRNRVRARAGFSAKVNDDVSATVRLATAANAADSAISSDQTLDDAAAKKAFWLDQAYFDWQAAQDLAIAGGKLPVPYWSAGDSELVWDGDLNLEGAAARWTMDTESLDCSLTAGGYWIDERADTAADPGVDLLLTGAQAVVAYRTRPIDLSLGVAYYTFAGLGGSPFQGRGARGNPASAANAGHYRSDFLPLVTALEIGWSDPLLPVRLFVERAENTAISGDRAAAAAGLVIGALKAPGSWSLTYSYQAIEPSALVGAFNDSDFGAGADARYHKARAWAQAADGVVAALAVYSGKTAATAGPRGYDRAQLDFLFEF